MSRAARLGLMLSLAVANPTLRTVAANAVAVYPSVGYKTSHTFSVEVDGKSVRVDQILQVHVAAFSLAGKADIVVHVPEEITRYQISPVSYRVLSAVEEYGREVRFTLERPRRVVLYVNNPPRLLIWAEAPEGDPPQPGETGVIDVTAFGAPNDGRHLATEEIRQAIAAVPHGGVLYFPPGIYRSGTIALKSNMTLYLAGGARIVGSALREHYPKIRDRIEADVVTDPENHWRKGKQLSYRQLLLIDGTENVSIRGRGVIDGNGAVLRAQGFFIYDLKVIESRNVLIEGITLTHSPAWFTHILHSDHVTVRDVKLVANREIPNGDGIDPDASRHVLIEDNLFLSNDDFVAVKVTANAGLTRDVDDIVVRGNVAIAECSALKIGTEVNDDRTIRNVLFEDNDILECDRGMSIYMEDGGRAENIPFVNNRFERVFIEGRRQFFDFYIENRYGAGRIHNVLIRDCVALVPWPLPSSMIGLDADHRITDVRIENLVIAGQPVRSAADIPLKTNGFVDGVQIK